jgi:hypothetical protein
VVSAASPRIGGCDSGATARPLLGVEIVISVECRAQGGFNGRRALVL